MTVINFLKYFQNLILYYLILHLSLWTFGKKPSLLSELLSFSMALFNIFGNNWNTMRSVSSNSCCCCCCCWVYGSVDDVTARIFATTCPYCLYWNMDVGLYFSSTPPVSTSSENTKKQLVNTWITFVFVNI